MILFGKHFNLFVLCYKQVFDYCLIDLFILFLLVQPNEMTFFSHNVLDTEKPQQTVRNQLSPHGGDSNHKRHGHQWKHGESELAGGGSNPSVAVVPVPLGPISLSDAGRLCRAGGRVASGFVIGGRVRPITWPVIIVPFTVVSAP